MEADVITHDVVVDVADEPRADDRAEIYLRDHDGHTFRVVTHSWFAVHLASLARTPLCLAGPRHMSRVAAVGG